MEPGGFSSVPHLYIYSPLLFHIMLIMNLKIKKKIDEMIPEIEWTNEENDLVFTPESLNFNTFIRAFSKNKLQRQFLERKLCNYYLIEN